MSCGQQQHGAHDINKSDQCTQVPPHCRSIQSQQISSPQEGGLKRRVFDVYACKSRGSKLALQQHNSLKSELKNKCSSRRGGSTASRTHLLVEGEVDGGKGPEREQSGGISAINAAQPLLPKDCAQSMRGAVVVRSTRGGCTALCLYLQALLHHIHGHEENATAERDRSAVCNALLECYESGCCISSPESLR